jgi:Mn2+/Fe2+ NRAMP family transporter
MVRLLEPFAGRIGVTIFVFGIIAAGVSSQFPNVMLLPWLLCDYFGRDRDMTLPRYRIMVGMLSLLGLVVPIFNAKPVVVMIASQAFGSFLLPVTVLSILILGNKRAVMGDHKHSVIENMILLSIFVFSVIMSFYGLCGLWSTLLTLSS